MSFCLSRYFGLKSKVFWLKYSEVHLTLHGIMAIGTKAKQEQEKYLDFYDVYP